MKISERTRLATFEMMVDVVAAMWLNERIDEISFLASKGSFFFISGNIEGLTLC